ncbi:hypothetical protein P9112_013126 [Eukaryota sp. TZLM1-RC]
MFVWRSANVTIIEMCKLHQIFAYNSPPHQLNKNRILMVKAPFPDFFNPSHKTVVLDLSDPAESSPFEPPEDVAFEPGPSLFPSLINVNPHNVVHDTSSSSETESSHYDDPMPCPFPSVHPEPSSEPEPDPSQNNLFPIDRDMTSYQETQAYLFLQEKDMQDESLRRIWAEPQIRPCIEEFTNIKVHVFRNLLPQRQVAQYESFSCTLYFQPEKPFPLHRVEEVAKMILQDGGTFSVQEISPQFFLVTFNCRKVEPVRALDLILGDNNIWLSASEMHINVYHEKIELTAIYSSGKNASTIQKSLQSKLPNCVIELVNENKKGISIAKFDVFSKSSETNLSQSLNSASKQIHDFIVVIHRGAASDLKIKHAWELAIVPQTDLELAKAALITTFDLTEKRCWLVTFGRRLILLTEHNRCPINEKSSFKLREDSEVESIVAFVNRLHFGFPLPMLLKEESPHLTLAKSYNTLINKYGSFMETVLSKFDVNNIRRRSNGAYRLALCIVQAHTISAVGGNKYAIFDNNTKNKTEVKLHVPNLINHVYSFDDVINHSFSPLEQKKTSSVQPMPKDCLECAISIKPNRNRVVGVLNMANEEHPGGGYLTGASAQEESLFRRTTLGAALDPEQYGGQVVSGQRVAYPWKTAKIDVVVTENVEIFKTTEATGCQLLEKPQRVTIISTAAPQEPEISEVENFGEDYAHFDDLQLLYKRWTCVFLAAIKHGITHLVICPLGCGAFRNPIPGAMTVLSFVLSIFHKFFDSIIFSGFSDQLNQCASLLKTDLVATNLKSLKLPCPQLPNKCTNLKDKDHAQRFIHLPICPNGTDCSLRSSKTHTALFFHTKPCKYFTNCLHHHQDPGHDAAFEHAPSCRDGPHCQNLSEKHRASFYHRPSCPNGTNCREKNKKCLYNHDRVQCPFKNCVDLTSEHVNNFNHVRLAEDPFVGGSGPMVYERFVCRHGTRCTDKSPDHIKHFIHLNRLNCPDKNCSSTDNNHLALYQHNNAPHPRHECRHRVGCTEQSDPNHLQMFSHPSSKIFQIVGSLRPPSLSADHEINFYENAIKLGKFVVPSGTKSVPENIASIAQFILGFKPTHRIKVEPFLSSLAHGNFYSLNFMKNKLGNSDTIESIARNHHRLHKFSNRSTVADYLATAAKNEFSRLSGQEVDVAAQQESKKLLNLPNEALKELNQLATGIAQAAITLNQQANSEEVGIGYDKDRALKTDHTVFTNLGPNTFHRYGPISVFFSDELSKHPASFVHLTAATLYYSQGNLDDAGRSYIKLPSKTHSNERIRFYYSLIQNMGCIKASEVLAWDLARMVAEKRKVGVSTVTCQMCLETIFSIDSHHTFECHLAPMIPFSYVRHILMPKSTFKELSAEAQKQLNDLNAVTPGFLVLTDGDVSSKEYLDHAADLSTNSEDANQCSKGYSFVLTPQPLCNSLQLREVFNNGYPIRVAFKVNASTNFHLQIIAKASGMCFSFNEGNVIVFNSTNLHDGQQIANQRLYFPSRMKELYIKFGLVINRDNGEIKLERIGAETAFKFPPLEFVHAQLKCKSKDVCIGFKLNGDGYASFKEVFVNAAQRHLHSAKSIADQTMEKAPTSTRNATPTTPTTPTTSESTESKPLCRNPWTCEYYYDGSKAKTAAGQTHLSNFVHICRFGSGCRDKDDASHCALFHHLEREECRHGERCRDIVDPKHRFQFSHGSLPLIPYKCMNGSKCKNKNDPRCYKKYGHWEVNSDPAGIPMPRLSGSKGTASGILGKIGSVFGIGGEEPKDSNSKSRSNSKSTPSYSSYDKKPKPSVKPSTGLSLDFIKKQDINTDMSAVFVFDATASMGSYIAETAENIIRMGGELEKSLSSTASSYGYTSTVKVNLGFVAYRDIGDSAPFEVLPFGNLSTLSSKIRSVRAAGGGDAPEDICTGLDKALELSWPKGHRMIFIVGDAPNHGSRFNCGTGDNHPKDPSGRTWESRFDAILAKSKELSINYLMCPVGNHSYFDPMIQYFKGSLSGSSVTKLSLTDGKLLDSIKAATDASYDSYLSKL